MSILTAEIRAGKVRGIETETKGITAFLGIPYAAAPVGELRWRGPAAPEKWDGVRTCDAFGPSCWQRADPRAARPLRMDEDCLSLNVWTPADSADDRLPVMVWFYGGGLQAGTSDDVLFDGEGLCGYGVVLVTVNYRTGAFGYFAHDELEKENGHATSGNYGLQDQLFSLRWVRDNIASFGGDPENVTIFGCSGGGRSVQGIACSPLGKGLVRHAVCHSAGGLNPDYSTAYGALKEMGREFVAFCGKKNVLEMRAIPAKELQALYQAYGKWFNITGDGYFLPYTMDEIVRRGEQADIDYILSTTNNEFRFPPKGEVTLANFDEWRPRFGTRTSILGAVVQPGTDAEARDIVENAEAYEMKSAQAAWARVQAGQPKKPAYVCTFVHPVPGRDGGTYHGDDQAYVFHTLFKLGRPYGEKDEALSRRMMKAWTNFAKTGDPNGEGLPVWTPYTAQSPLTMLIDTDEGRMEDTSNHFMEEIVAAYISGRRGR